MNNKSKIGREDKFHLPEDFKTRVADKINDILSNGGWCPYYRVYDEVSNQTVIVEYPYGDSIEILSMDEGKTSGLGAFICYPSELNKATDKEKALTCECISQQFTSYMSQYYHDVTTSILMGEVLKRSDVTTITDAKNHILSSIEAVTADYMPNLDSYRALIEEGAKMTAEALIPASLVKEGKLDEAVKDLMEQDIWGGFGSKDVN